MSRCIRITLLMTLLIAGTANATVLHFSGETVIRSIQPTRIAVFVDSTADGVVDQGFLLSTDIAMADGLAVHFPKAAVEFSDGYVRVTSGERVFDLQVAGYSGVPAPPAGSRVTTLIGYALTHSSGDSGCDVDRAYGGDAGDCFSYGRE